MLIGGAVITRRRYPSANVARQAMMTYCGGASRRPTDYTVKCSAQQICCADRVALSDCLGSCAHAAGDAQNLCRGADDVSSIGDVEYSDLVLADVQYQSRSMGSCGTGCAALKSPVL